MKYLSVVVTFLPEEHRNIETIIKILCRELTFFNMYYDVFMFNQKFFVNLISFC